MTLELSDIASVCTGRKVAVKCDRKIDTLLTDSRQLIDSDPASALFFALRTSVNDGHRFVADLYRKGVRSFVVEAIPEIMADVSDADFIVVENTLAALHAVGRAVRERLADTTVIGITGSRGKTEVKELLFSAMQRAGKRVMRSPRSWNSQIGVPMSLWAVEPDTEIAIIEAGIDHSGQMDSLAAMIRPQIGVLTAITEEHDSGFDSREEKVAEKRRLFAGCEYVAEGGDNRRLAADVLGRLGLDASLLDGLTPVSTRLDVHDGVNDCLMITDGFTNDIDSLLPALDFMRRRTTSSRRNTLIIGDLSHGPADDVEAVYCRLAQLVKVASIDRMIGVGKEITSYRRLFDPLTASEFMADTDEFLDKYDISRFDSELILIKGGADSGFERLSRRLETPRHQTILEVNLDSAIHNFNAFRALLRPTTGVVAMVKASGYGTGALELAKSLQSQGAAYLAVAVVEEGVALRRAGITMPIMVLNPMTTNYQALFNYGLEPAVFSLRELRMLMDEARRYGRHNNPIHIKFDTGMHRLGFLAGEIDELAAMLHETDFVNVSSAFSHLATADCLDEDAYTESQFDAFEAMTEAFAKALGRPFKRHILNTAGIMRYPDRQYDMVRLGIGLYGISPLPPEATNIDLRTVARLTTTIISLKNWSPATTIGYSRRGVLERESVIATVPIGYADGIDRHFSCGRASFVVNGHLCPTVGNICMDLCMIDVTGAGAAIGDRVEIFGPEAPIERLADTLGTIPYEILTSVSPRIHRIYFRE